MSYPALVTVWSSMYSSATFLEVLDCIDFQFQNNQLGGPGAGKFTIFSKYEDSQTSNLLASNRIDAYVYRDQNTATASSGATTVTVNDGNRFANGNLIALYNGVTQDFVKVTGVAANVVTFTPALTNTYLSTSTVMLLGYRGRITARERTPQLDYYTNVETMGYFAELNDFVIDGLGVNARECGWVIYNIIQQYASSMDLTVSSGNFVMTTDAGGLVNGTGTNVAYTTNQGQRPLLAVLQEIVKQANANNSNITYALYCDAANNIYFQALPTTTPTVNLTLNPQVLPGDGVVDIVGDLLTRDQDLVNVINTYKLVGGKDSTGTPVQCEVFDQTSVNTYGQKEAIVSVPSITDLTSLKSYGQSRLDVTAYPVETVQATLIATRSFITGQDYLGITGFQNLAPNADFLPTSMSMPANQQWSIVGAGIASSITTGPGGTHRGYIYTGTGAASGNKYVNSATINLVANNTYTFSLWMDPSHISAGSAMVAIYDSGITTLLASTTVPNGASGRFSVTYTPTTAKAVKLLFYTNNCTVTSAQPLAFSQPMLEHAATASTVYVPNTDLFINIQSVQTEWKNDNVVIQKVQAAELVPDKNRLMREIAAQHYIANLGTIGSSVNLSDRFVQSGLEGSITSTTFSLTAGVLFANVLVAGVPTLTEFDTSSFTLTPGADGLYTIALLYRKSDGTIFGSPAIVSYTGTVPPSTSTYTYDQIVPLYRVTALGGVLVDMRDVRNLGGVSGTNILTGAVSDHHISAYIPRKNLVYNGNNCGGTGAVSPSLYGWTSFNGAGSPVTDSAYGVYASIRTVKTGATVEGFSQNVIGLVPGQTYTYTALVFADSTGMVPTVWVGNAAGTTQYNTTVGTPVGSLANTLYTAYSSTAVNNNHTSLWSQWVCLYGSFVCPSSVGSAMFLIYDNSTTGAGAKLYANGLMLTEGNRLQDYIDQEPNAGGITYDRHIVGNMTGTAPLVLNCSASTAYQTDMMLHTVVGTTPFPMKFYIDNGTGSTAPKVWNPSAPASPVTLSFYGTAASPIALPAPLTTTAGTDTIFILASYVPGSTAGVINTYAANVLQNSSATSNAWTVYAQKNANFSPALAAALFADGYTMLFTTANGGSTFTGGSGGGGSKGGSGGRTY